MTQYTRAVQYTPFQEPSFQNVFSRQFFKSKQYNQLKISGKLKNWGTMEFPPEKPSERLLKAKSALKDKGYAFSSSKKMCQLTLDGAIQEDSKFVFEVKKDDREFNQKNYEELGDIITEFVYGLLESTPMCLKRKEIPPADPKTDQSTTRSFVYVSENFTGIEKLQRSRTLVTYLHNLYMFY